MRAIVLLLIPLSLATVLAAGCGSRDAEPVQLQLPDLVRFANRYDGDLVATTGVVHMFPDPKHYWIEDDDVNRVEIHPQSAVSDLVGQHVRVVGRFHYDPQKGRRIDARETTKLE